jgi:dipeptidyl aminopeptidase/acylaminoacyl peptidase
MVMGVETGRRFLSIDDVIDLRVVSDVQMAPGGDRIAFVVADGFKSHDEPAQSRVWLADVASGSAAAFTAGPRSDREPRWSPDGRHLAFTSDRIEKGKHQLFVIDVAAGEARRVVETPTKVSQPAWSPDGRSIAFIATDPNTEEEKKRKDEHDDAEVADAAPKFDRLHVVDVASGTARQVTQGNDHVWEFDWSPDGLRFVLLTGPRPGDNGWFDAELSIVEASGGEPQRLVWTGKQFAVPRWSPDGRHVAFISCTWSDPGLVGGDLFVVDVASRNVRNLTEARPLSASWLQWKRDSSGLVFMAHEDGNVGLNEIDLAERTIERHWLEPFTCAERSQPRFSTDARGELFAVAREDPARPRDIWTFSRGGDWRKLTQLHAGFEQFRLGPVSDEHWRSRDGRAIQGLLIRPADSDTRPPFPLVVQVHGGPANIWPHRLFATWHDWGQWLAARGYAVFLPNFRGSFGWGSEFTEANLGDMGGSDFDDIMAGVDHLVAAGVADPARLAICGWSYGGFMTAWAVTQTDRFRTAVMGAGISNWLSFHGTAEIHSWDVLFWRESPFVRDGRYTRFSPITHVSGAKTPTLIVHGANDCCVPVGQSQEFYRALRDQDVPTELVMYPREGHAIQEKNHQRDLLTRVRNWIDRWLGTNGTP